MNPKTLEKFKKQLAKFKALYDEYSVVFQANGISLKEQQKLDKWSHSMKIISAKIEELEEALKEKFEALYITLPTEEKKVEQVCHINLKALLKPSKKVKKDPFLTRKQLLARIKRINEYKELKDRNITLSFSENTGFSITSSDNDRYILNNGTIEDRISQIPPILKNGIKLPDGAVLGKEMLQQMIGNLNKKVDKYERTQQAIDTEIDLIRANINSLLLKEEDLKKIQKFKEIYLGKNRKHCILDDANILNKNANKYQKACKEHFYKIGEQVFDQNIYNALVIDLSKNPYKDMAEDWAIDGKYTLLEKDLIEALEKSKVRVEATGEPKILAEHKDDEENNNFTIQDIDLPYSNQGTKLDGSLDDSPTALNDIDQGALGDCYYLSSIGAIANTHSELFDLNSPKSIVKEEKDKYIVTLHLRKDKNSMERTPIQIEVSKKALVDNRQNNASNGNPIYAGTGDNELWVMTLERALAQEMGGFDNIVGGQAGLAMEMLTGGASSTILFKEIEGDKKQYLLST